MAKVMMVHYKTAERREVTMFTLASVMEMVMCHGSTLMGNKYVVYETFILVKFTLN
jgi:hypothetical protein